MSNLNTMFEEDAGALTVKDEDLSSVAALAKRAKLLEKEIEEHESVLKERQEQLRKLQEESIPNMLAELGMERLHHGRWQQDHRQALLLCIHQGGEQGPGVRVAA